MSEQELPENCCNMSYKILQVVYFKKGKKKESNQI